MSKAVTSPMAKSTKPKTTKPTTTRTIQPLCFRCEHRAVAWETGHGPRYECTDTSNAVHSCYQYKPTRGVALQKDEGDLREIGAPAMIAARAHGVGIVPGDYVMRRRNGLVLIYYVPAP